MARAGRARAAREGRETGEARPGCERVLTRRRAAAPATAARPGAAREAALGLGVYGLALLVRRAVWNDRGRRRAIRNATRVASLERRLGLDVAPVLQRRLLPRRRLVAALNGIYVGANIAITIGALAVLRRRGDPAYRPLRRSVAGTLLAAQAPFLAFPTAPPRRLDDRVDTMQAVSGIDLDGGLVGRLYNPLAAMPSIHLSWAVISAESLRACSGGRTVRAAAAVYPPAVAGVVLATANHFVLDVIAGAALGHAALTASGARRVRRSGDRGS
jgi:PAP2 superfamily